MQTLGVTGRPVKANLWLRPSAIRWPDCSGDAVLDGAVFGYGMPTSFLKLSMPPPSQESRTKHR